jgi:uncharacterized protein YndB with AHSA1/START domain
MSANDSRTKVERSEREIAVSHTFNAPLQIVYDAWSKPDLFKRWWAPKSMGVPMISCEMDVRTGGGYRIAFGHNPAEAMAFFGKYIEVVPNVRMVWTNEEGEDGAVTTVTFEEKGGGKTLVVLRERYPSKDALDASQGAEGALPEQFAQLDELLAELGADVG